MDKQQFKDEINDIEVPQLDVCTAIKKGILKAQKEKPIKRKTKPLAIPLIASTLLIGFFSSGFIFPQMSRVLADVPLIGKIYSSFDDSIGENLAASKLVTELNQKAISNGVGVTMNSVYYDGGRISVTFKVDHFNAKSNEFMFDIGNIADGSDKWMNAAQFDGVVTSNGDHIGQIIIDYPDKEFPKDMTLPITLKAINETKGEWRFDIPIHQLPNHKVNVGQASTSDDKEHALNFETITVGKESAVLDYKAIYPLTGKDDMARIDKVIDNQGNEISVLSSGTEFSRKKIGNRIESNERTIIGKIPNHAKFIKVYPYIRQSEKSLPPIKVYLNR